MRINWLWGGNSPTNKIIVYLILWVLRKGVTINKKVFIANFLNFLRLKNVVKVSETSLDLLVDFVNLYEGELVTGNDYLFIDLLEEDFVRLEI